MEAGIGKFWVKFKSLILALIFLGILMLVIALILAPDKREQIIEIMILFSAFFIMIPFLIIIFKYLEERR